MVSYGGTHHHKKNPRLYLTNLTIEPLCYPRVYIKLAYRSGEEGIQDVLRLGVLAYRIQLINLRDSEIPVLLDNLGACIRAVPRFLASAADALEALLPFMSRLFADAALCNA